MCLDVFCFVNAADFSPDSEQNTFTGGEVIMDYELYGIRVKFILMLDLFQLLMLTDGLECCDVFISSHSDGTHSLPLLRHSSKPDEETHSSWSCMIPRVLIFGWAIPLNLNLWRLELYWSWTKVSDSLICGVGARIRSVFLLQIWDQLHLLRAVLRELLWTSQMSNHCCSTSLRGISLRSLPLTILQNHEPFSRNTVLCV